MAHYGILIFLTNSKAYFSSHQFTNFNAASSDWEALLTSDCTGWSLGNEEVVFGSFQNLCFYEDFGETDMSPIQLENIIDSIPDFLNFVFATW